MKELVLNHGQQLISYKRITYPLQYIDGRIDRKRNIILYLFGSRTHNEFLKQTNAWFSGFPEHCAAPESFLAGKLHRENHLTCHSLSSLARQKDLHKSRVDRDARGESGCTEWIGTHGVNRDLGLQCSTCRERYVPTYPGCPDPPLLAVLTRRMMKFDTHGQIDG